MQTKNNHRHHEENTDDQNTMEIPKTADDEYFTPPPPQQESVRKNSAPKPYPQPTRSHNDTYNPQQRHQQQRTVQNHQTNYDGNNNYGNYNGGYYGGSPQPYPQQNNGNYYGSPPPYAPQNYGYGGSPQPYYPGYDDSAPDYYSQQQQREQYYAERSPQQNRKTNSSSSGKSSGKTKNSSSSKTKSRSGSNSSKSGSKSNKRKSAPEPSPKRKKKKGGGCLGRIVKKIISTLLVIFLILLAIYSALALFFISKVNKVPIGERSRNNSAVSSAEISNVLVIGSDGRNSDDKGRSDTMILLSLNPIKRQLTITSFMRDCYVEIDGYGWDKLNSAYSYGGAELLMDTIENNFGIKINHYVQVNFMSFVSIIDAVGGVDVDITDEEAQEINNILISEVNGLMGDGVSDDLLSGGGKIHLSGKQALSYARIRYVGNADFERTQRQRYLMSQLAKNAIKIRPSSIGDIANNVMPQTSSDMNTAQMYLLSLQIPLFAVYDIQQLRIPSDGTFYSEYNDSGDVLQVDLETNHKIIRQQVYGY